MSSTFAPDSKQHPIRFGVALPPAATSLDEQLLLAQAADAAGLDLIGVMDHPQHPRYLDTLSLIGMLLARTERVHIFPDVANLPLRPPEMPAKAAASPAAPIRGHAAQWAGVITYLVDELRFDAVVFWPEQASVARIERFAEIATEFLNSRDSRPLPMNRQPVNRGGSHA